MHSEYVNVCNHWFITGLADSEGTFTILIDNNSKRTIGWRVQAKFQIGLHKRDLELLLQVKKFFGDIGSISKSDNMVFYSVSSLKDLSNIIIPHFSKYPLLTQKAADFLLFKDIVKIMTNKGHLSIEGFKQIINIKASMNFGTISESIMSMFSSIEPVKRPERTDFTIYHPYWVVGYVEGEGMFFVNIYKRKDTVLGEGVKLVFKITQDRKNLALLESFTSVFTVGKVYKQSPTVRVLDFMITGLADITKYLIPFFQAYPLEGAKKEDFEDFVKVGELMKSKAHLNKDGLEQIRLIKSGMNSNRY